MTTRATNEKALEANFGVVPFVCVLIMPRIINIPSARLANGFKG